ncbi:hypothetical protein AB6H27_22760 [Providencia huaxiensis]|uniref:hypothetical protein n=1 Tax=Providencia TaxID=586 RepID=UPI0018C6E67C|nr:MULTISPECIES: hypothetical protein [Providencia]MBG5918997.1 hypothetical protein [Providencia stuartii]MCB6144834.1 hypothetical protein [Providencia rettgeri]MCF8964339.1 hypothetical protein [Providencia rettgeri]MCG9940268.1 hypothetical protein [Providencia rettgeri]MCK9999338.1 hypothetical protein [Providencia rettgeri]
MQTNSTNPIITFNNPMSTEEIHAWILEKAAALKKLEELNSYYAELKSKLEKTEDDIYEQTEICNEGLGLVIAS